MTRSLRQYKRMIAGLGLAGMLTVSMAMPAFAAETAVGAAVTGGTLAATIDTTLTVTTVEYDYALAQEITNTPMALTVDDSTGLADGWNVQIISSVFDHTGGDGTTDIGAAAFVLSTPGAPSLNSGQAISIVAGEGPEVGVGGSLDTSRKVIKAAADFGQGNYGQSLPSTFTYPVRAQAGAYTATLTTSLVAGPGGI